MRTSHAFSDPAAQAAPATQPSDAASRFTAAPRPIDLVHLTRQTFGDKRLETELLRLFIRQAEQIDDALSAPSSGPQSARDLLHILLGSARAVGATQVSALAERLEHDRRHGGEADELSAPDRAALSAAIAAARGYIADLLEPA